MPCPRPRRQQPRLKHIADGSVAGTMSLNAVTGIAQPGTVTPPNRSNRKQRLWKRLWRTRSVRNSGHTQQGCLDRHLATDITQQSALRDTHVAPGITQQSALRGGGGRQARAQTWRSGGGVGGAHRSLRVQCCLVPDHNRSSHTRLSHNRLCCESR
eukprot:1515101-Rhodomonas_salina.2